MYLRKRHTVTYIYVLTIYRLHDFFQISNFNLKYNLATVSKNILAFMFYTFVILLSNRQIKSRSDVFNAAYLGVYPR